MAPEVVCAELQSGHAHTKAVEMPEPVIHIFVEPQSEPSKGPRRAFSLLIYPVRGFCCQRVDTGNHVQSYGIIPDSRPGAFGTFLLVYDGKLAVHISLVNRSERDIFHFRSSGIIHTNNKICEAL
jgi:hypothetical protein